MQERLGYGDAGYSGPQETKLTHPRIWSFLLKPHALLHDGRDTDIY